MVFRNAGLKMRARIFRSWKLRRGTVRYKKKCSFWSS